MRVPARGGGGGGGGGRAERTLALLLLGPMARCALAQRCTLTLRHQPGGCLQAELQHGSSGGDGVVCKGTAARSVTQLPAVFAWKNARACCRWLGHFAFG